MKNLLFLVLMCVVVLAAACKKKGIGEKTTGVTKENLVGLYKIKSIFARNGNAAPVDMFTLIEDCQKDDMQRINADMSYNYIDTGIVCSPGGHFTASWSVPDSKTIIFNGDTTTVQSFNGKDLVFTVYSQINGVRHLLTVTLEKQ